jgi:acyl carrier protein
MTEPAIERVRNIAADVLNTPPQQITSQSSPETIAGWDSVQHLNLILALEEEFGIQFEPEEIEQMGSIERILAVLDGRAEQARLA